MVNFNGIISGDASAVDLSRNRSFRYGDGIFETMKVRSGQILFIEDHYFRLMAGMRILRMEIPMSFTMEYIAEQVLTIAGEQNLTESARVRFAVFRNEGGNYLPSSNNISFLITAEPAERDYTCSMRSYEVDLYKDFYVSAQLLSTVKTANRLVNITGSVFAEENGLDDCLLLNDKKNVVGALQGNIFMLSGSKLITPSLTEGCVKGVMRTQVLRLVSKMEEIELEEGVISPFELQKADQLFVTNVIKGIQPVTRYRKKEYSTSLSMDLTERLNAMIM